MLRQIVIDATPVWLGLSPEMYLRNGDVAIVKYAKWYRDCVRKIEGLEPYGRTADCAEAPQAPAGIELRHTAIGRIKA